MGNSCAGKKILQENLALVEKNVVGKSCVENPVQETCFGKLLSETCGKLLWENLVAKSCGKFLQENVAGNCCGKNLWEIVVGKSCGKIL